jgi:hypothetical protein
LISHRMKQHHFFPSFSRTGTETPLGASSRNS